MSHGRERKEKNCLNCNTVVQGRYCQNCGQENTEPHETFWGMVNHFFSDITHFDGKFFKTIAILLSKPGFLSKEYISGRRNSYLNPVRMYVFTASLFFLIFFALFSVKESNMNIFGKNNNSRSNSLVSVDLDDSLEAGDSASRVRNDWRNGKWVSYRTLREYDSAQAALPEVDRDGWVASMVERKRLDLNDRYPNQQGKMGADILNKFFHTLPYLLFLSLPLYGFFLYLLYVRRKRFFFADHGIFLIHQYVFTFMVLLILFLLMRLPYAWVNWLKAILIIYGLAYTLIAFRRFYGQGWMKSIFKFTLFNVICVISLAFLFVIFFGYAFFQV